MDTLQIGTMTRQVPGTWNELTRKQLLRVLPEVYSPSAADGGHRLRLLGLLSGYPLPLLAGLHPEVLARLLPLTEWVGSDQHLLTTQLLPTLRLIGRHVTEPPVTWHGPRESFRNLLFGEFIFADTFFVLYCQHHRPAHLDKFLTVLYRPARRDASPERDDWTGDVRLPFNEHQLEVRTPRVGPVPFAQKVAVLTWYRGCRAQLALEFPDVFLAAEPVAGLAQAPPDWGRVLRKLAGGAFGTVQQTAGQPVRSVLAEMQDLIQEHNRLKTSSTHA